MHEHPTNGNTSARRLMGALLCILTGMAGVPALASAYPRYMPTRANLINSDFECVTANSISFNIWDKIYKAKCIAAPWPEQIWDIHEVYDGLYINYYTIQSEFNGECLDVYAYRQEDGAAIVTWPCINGATNQRWSIEAHNGTYILRAEHSGKCLTGYPGVPWIRQWPCPGYTGQDWSIQGPVHGR
jgi:hypothetical protein